MAYTQADLDAVRQAKLALARGISRSAYLR